ncbi:MAG: hypothetical protein V7707_10690 [Motiliproteus sp.]
MMEILMMIVIAALAGGCGYLGGRWYAAHKQAYLQAKLDSDTENFVTMLEERNQDYVRQKEQINKARSQSGQVQIEHDRAKAQVELEQQNTARLQSQIDELTEKQQRMRNRYSELEESRIEFREQKRVAEAELKRLEQSNIELRHRNDHIEQKFSTALVDKTRIQSDTAAKERELQELRQRLVKQEDLNQSGDFTLAQMRSNREELLRELAQAQGQLAMIETLKQTLKAPSQPLTDNSQLKQDFTELTGNLSG